MRSVPVACSCIFLVVSPSCAADRGASSADGGRQEPAGSGGAVGTGGAAGDAGRSNAGGASAGGATAGRAGAGGKAAGAGGAPPSGAGGRAGSAGATGGSNAADGGEKDGGAAGASNDAGPGGYPDESTTGPHLEKCAGGKLQKYAGNSAYRPASNEVVSCKEFDDQTIYIPAEVSNVTIENCRFVATVDTFVNIQGARVTIQDSEFHGPAETWIRNSYSGDHLTVRRNEFTGMGNAVEFNVGYETIEDNYIHDFGTANPQQHADGLQTDGTSHALIRHNTVLLGDVAGATGAISVFGNSGDDVLVEGNKVAGGGYTVYAGGSGFTNIRFIDNCFSNVFYPGKAQTGRYAPWYPSDNLKDVVRTGNTWCDGPKAGEPLNANP